MKKIYIFLFIVLAAIAGHAQSTGKTEALTAMGGACGLLLYNTHMVLGMDADAFAEEVYNADKAIEIVAEQLGGVETILKQYDDLIHSGFLTDKEDIKFMKELVAAFGLVQDEGLALQQYIEDGTNGSAAKYDANRQTAWKEIQRLLGME